MSAFPQKWIAKVPETWQHICRHSHEGTGTKAPPSQPRGNRHRGTAVTATREQAPRHRRHSHEGTGTEAPPSQPPGNRHRGTAVTATREQAPRHRRHSHEETGTEALRVAVQSGAAHREGREPAGSKDMHEEIPAWSSSRTGSKLPWRCSHTRLLFPYYP